MNELTTVNQLKTEIIFYKNQTAQNILEIGKRLVQVKRQLPHGEFMKWCEREVEFSHNTANNFMKCYEEFGNSPTSGNLSSSKMIELLSIPTEQRNEFMEQNDVAEMTIKQLRGEISLIKKKAKDDEEALKGMAELNSDLQRKLQEKPKPEIKEVIKEVEKIPDDYESTKNLYSLMKQNYREVTKQKEELIKENESLKQQQTDKKNSNLDVLNPVSLQVHLSIFARDTAKYLVLTEDLARLDGKERETTIRLLDVIENQLIKMKYAITGHEIQEVIYE